MNKEKELETVRNNIKECKKALYDLRKYLNNSDYPLTVKETIKFYENNLNKLLIKEKKLMEN